MNLYKKYILPRFLNSGMKKEVLRTERPGVIEHASGNVLEIGFGSGLNLPFYKNITKLYAVDPSLELYNLAKGEIEKVSFPVEFIQASAEKLPFPDNFFDSVVSTWTLCSVSDPKLALKEIARVLKPSGKFTFIEHGRSPKVVWSVLQNIITPFSKPFTGNCHLNRAIDKMIINKQFKIIKLEKFTEKYKPLFFSYKGIAIIENWAQKKTVEFLC